MSANKIMTLKPMMVDLNQIYGLIEASGKEAATFLQGQLTSDIRQITPMQGGLSAYCNVKGRIRALLRIFLYQDSYYLQLPKLLLPKILAQLQQYAKFSKVNLKDVSTEWQCIGIEINDTIHTLLSQQSNTLVQLSITHQMPYPRSELFGPATLLAPLWQALSLHTEIHSFTDWLLLDIRNGIPEVWPETSELFLPHFLNLPKLGAVSFNKGCYCGQEIIARMEYRANIKRHLFHAVLATSLLPPPGTPIWRKDAKEEPVGTVVSASLTLDNIVELLIETLDLVVENNDLLTIDLQNRRIALTTLTSVS